MAARVSAAIYEEIESNNTFTKPDIWIGKDLSHY